MTEMNHIPKVHSTKTLVVSSLVAAVFAGLILVVAILPAEYDIDPTGFGKNFGLTKLANATTPPVQPVPIESARTYQKAKVEIVVPAQSGLEYKFDITLNDKISYQWNTDGAALYFDFHGEPEGDTTGFFESYTISTANNAEGTMTAPFNGSHGWYWKNETGNPIVVQLFTQGKYVLIGKK